MNGQAHCIGLHPALRRSDVAMPVLAGRDRLIADLEARDAEVEHFTYTVSHDLKNPLITIKGFLTLLKRDAATGDLELLADDIRQISQATDRLHRLLDELFEYHRIGRRPNTPERLPLSALARQALDFVSDEIDERGLKVVIAPELPAVVGDAAHLLEVFQRLFQNALRFMGDEPSPRLEVGVRQLDGETVCYVRDNGLGVEPRHHKRIFRLFRRLEGGRSGTGAGLAMVKRIVEVHGGRIWVESEGPGSGATFCFSLPTELQTETSPDSKPSTNTTSQA